MMMMGNTGPHRTTPDHTGPVPGRKWLIISLRRLLRVELRGAPGEFHHPGLGLGLGIGLGTGVVKFSGSANKIKLKSYITNHAQDSALESSLV